MGIKNFLWLVVLASLWGPAFLLMKVAVEDIPPFTIVAGRVAIAAIVLYIVLKMQGYSLPKFGPMWKHFAIAGFTLNALPYALLSWGEQHIDSALASILIGTDPIFVVLLAHIFTNDDRLTPSKALGALVGFGGLVALVAPALFEGVHATTWGLLAAVGAAASYAVGMVYVRQTLRGLPPLVGPTAQVSTAALYMIPLSLVFDRSYALPTPSWQAIAAVLTLAVVSTALTYVIYYWLMERTEATNVAMVAYLVPITGTIMSVVVLHERLGWNAYLAFALIMIGLMFVNGLIKPATWRRRVTDTMFRPSAAH